MVEQCSDAGSEGQSLSVTPSYRIAAYIQRETGAAAVEFALLLPLLTLILFGIMVFGLLFGSYLGITHASKEGARWAALRADRAEVIERVKESAPMIDWSRAAIDVRGIPESGATDDNQGDPVTVHITYNLPEAFLVLRDSLNGLGSIFGAGSVIPGTINSEATARVE